MSTENPNTAVEELLAYVKHHEQSAAVRLLVDELGAVPTRLVAFRVHKLLRRQFLYGHEKPAVTSRIQIQSMALPQAMVLWPQLGALFCIHDVHFNWREDVEVETKARLRKLAYEYYQPRLIL